MAMRSTTANTAAREALRNNDDEVTLLVSECHRDAWYGGMNMRDCRLAELWEQGQLCDIEVVAGGETFKAHRIVLAACSEFMQSLLTGPVQWRDSTGPLTLPDVDPSAFSTVLTWMYRGYVSVDRAAAYPTSRRRTYSAHPVRFNTGQPKNRGPSRTQSMV